MRSREEVLRECIDRAGTTEAEDAMYAAIDRIRELEAPCGEAVAWRVVYNHDGNPSEFVDAEGVRHTLSRTPPVAAVVSEAMVEAAARALFLDDTISHDTTWDDASPRLVKEFKAYARIALTAALRTTQGSASTEGGLTASRGGA